MKGWFDLFRADGGPTLYNHSNRTSVTADILTVIVCLVFATILAGFLLIFPGVRKQRFTTFTCVCLSVITGVAIMISACGSSWQTGTAVINTYYRAFSAETLHAKLGVHIGLGHVNITLQALPDNNFVGDIDFNERFRWGTPQQMKEEYSKALVKGLPFPILTVAEYLSICDAGFVWGFQYRKAGYYASIIIWTAFACWVLTNLLLLTVPRYGAYMMSVTGVLLCSAAAVYTSCSPSRPLSVRFENVQLQLALGWQFYMVLCIGVICTVFGAVASIIDLLFPNSFSTILEVDFGTPYDRHILIVESEEMRRRKPTLKIPKLEEPISAGIEATTKLIRRLSKRGGNDHSTDPKAGEPIKGHGVDNGAFELEPSASSGHRQRTSSRSSVKSISVNVLKRAFSGNHLVPGGSQHDVHRRVEMEHPNYSSSASGASALVTYEPAVGCGSVGNTVDLEDPWTHHGGQHRPLKLQLSNSSQRRSSHSSGSTISLGSPASSHMDQAMLMNPSGVTSVGSSTAGERSHPTLEKRDSRTSNIIVFHTQDARGDLTRRQSTDPTCLEP